MPPDHTIDKVSTPWPTSKCHRVLRPLKLKINALERALSTSYSVADGLTHWSTLSRRHGKPDPSSDSSSAYNPSSSRPRKYGNIRKQKLIKPLDGTGGSVSDYTEHLIGSLRSKVSPSLGSAYLGVYYAFTAVLEKKETKQKFPTLASRAAHIVGRCVHLTSHQFTDEPIEADDWYDSVPAHYRSTLVVGHALQLLLSSAESIGPLLPVIALFISDSPLANDVLSTILSRTEIANCRKSDIEELQALAERIHVPWALRRHFTEVYRIEHLKHPSFIALLNYKSADPLDKYAQALYLKVNLTILQHSRRKSQHEFTNDDKYYEAAEEMSRRVIRNSDTEFMTLLQSIYCEPVCDSALRHVALGFSLALLIVDPTNLALIQRIKSLSGQLLRGSAEMRASCLQYLMNIFAVEKVVEVVECLVGRDDDLAIILAKSSATEFEGDFIDWATTIERDVVHARNGPNDGKYRFEPLLDSWVAKTPGMQKIRYTKPFELNESETDEEQSSPDEEDYQADQSRSQLSFVELECEDENDLMEEFLTNSKNVPMNLLEVLSHKKCTEPLGSAQLLQRYGKLAGKSRHSDSPLAKKRSRVSMRQQLLCSSPVEVRVAKRPIEDQESPVKLAMSRVERIYVTRAKRLRSNHGRGTESIFVDHAAAIPEKRLARSALRELNKLKSGFASQRKRRTRKCMPLTLFMDTDTELEQREHVDSIEEGRDDLANDADDDIFATFKSQQLSSEADELAM